MHSIPVLNSNFDFKIIRKQADIPDGIDGNYECGTCLEQLVERSELDVNSARNNVYGYIVQLHQDEQTQAPHLFHFRCIKSWFQSEGRPRSCPLCRTKCKFYLTLTRTDIPEERDGVDFFEPLTNAKDVVAEKRQLNCSQYNDNQEECISNKPQCLWKFKNKLCINNLDYKGGMLKFISKQNKKRKFCKRSLKK